MLSSPRHWKEKEIKKKKTFYNPVCFLVSSLPSRPPSFLPLFSYRPVYHKITIAPIQPPPTGIHLKHPLVATFSYPMFLKRSFSFSCLLLFTPLTLHPSPLPQKSGTQLESHNIAYNILSNRTPFD